ncbi:uncharacterized protein LOC142009219 isoform X1 [Carettochelys insculpta]|uniref:uncharacterized protein LOC142009219 isoform X1 n=1 Tax=Carettochelys insculpta TaxID=44489 RepID=UPI003EBF4E33
MGYDIERFVGYVNEGLLCCICRDVLEDPLQAPCEHAFCTACIHGWLVHHNNCPEDRQALDMSVLRPLYRYMKNDLNRLQLRCKNRERGCEMVCSLESIDRHERECEYSQISCSNAGPEESAGEASVVPETPPGPSLQGSPSAEERPAPRRARRRTPRLLPAAATDPQLLAILRRQLEVSEQHFRLQEQALAWRREAWGAFLDTINRLIDSLAPHAAPPPAMPAPAAPPPAAPAVAGPSAVAPPPPREGHRAEGPLEPPATRRRRYLPVEPAPTQPRTRLQARRSCRPATPTAGL